MSFESARRILDSYKQKNAQRIQQGLELAYNEALSTYQSETAALDAAVKMLKSEQDSFDKYVQELQRARVSFLKGDQTQAKKQAEAITKAKKQNEYITWQNAVAEARWKNREAKRIASDKRRQEAIRAEESFREQAYDIEYADKAGTGKLEVDANKHATSQLKSDDIYNVSPFAKAKDDVLQGLKNNQTNAWMASLVQPLLSEISTQLSKTTKSKGYAFDVKDSLETKKADLYHYLVNAFSPYEKINKDGYDTVITYLTESLDKRVDPSALSGIFKDVKNITETEVKDRFQKEVDAFKSDKAKASKGAKRQTYIPTPAEPKPIPKPLLKVPADQTIDDTQTSLLREQAQPYFDALRNDYMLDDNEYAYLQENYPESINAYQALQQEVIRNPLAVTQEEELLLDQIALNRQYELQQRKSGISKMHPQMQSTEAIKRRAGELIQPTKAQAQSALSPRDQKYFAVERKALDLSEKDDASLRDMGAPEKYGLLLYQKMFNPTTKTFNDGKTYDDALADMDRQFQNDPEGQMRAMSAFISRGMALERSSAPLYFKNGKANKEYYEALKALGK